MNFYDLLQKVDGPDSNYELKPLSDEDMALTSRDDSAEWMLKHGKKPIVGEPMSDEEFQKFHRLV